jgi:hypothetical protein
MDTLGEVSSFKFNRYVPTTSQGGRVHLPLPSPAESRFAALSDANQGNVAAADVGCQRADIQEQGPAIVRFFLQDIHAAKGINCRVSEPIQWFVMAGARRSLRQVSVVV